MQHIFGKSLKVVSILSGASLVLTLVPTPDKASAAIVPSTPNNAIYSQAQYTDLGFNTIANPVFICTPTFSLSKPDPASPTGFSCDTSKFVGNQVVGYGGATYPELNGVSQPSFTAQDVDSFDIPVLNNSPYYITKVQYNPTNQIKFDSTALTPNLDPTLQFCGNTTTPSSAGNLFNVTCDPATDTLTFTADNGAKGVAPGQYFNIHKFFTVPQSQIGHPVKEQAILTFTNPNFLAQAAIPESSSPLAILAVGVLGAIGVATQKLKKI